MIKKLITDMMRTLQQEIEHDTFIKLNINNDLVQDMAALLQTYKLTRARKLAILGSYTLLCSAIRKHGEIRLDDNSLALTRGILDGDYLFGLNIRLLMQQEENTLIQHFIPLYKKVQLKLIEGISLDAIVAELFDHMKQYLKEHCSSAGGDDHEVA